MKRKKIILTFALAIIMLATASPAFAFELSYPKAGDVELNTGDSIQQTVRYIYTLLVSLVGIAAFISIALGGAMRLTSGGDPGKIAESKKRITAGLTGSFLILLTYLILNFINPSLTTITLTKAPPKPLFTPDSLAGTFICKEGFTLPSGSLPDQRQWMFDQVNSEDKNCQKMYEGKNPIPIGYEGTNFNIQIIRTSVDPYYYAILLGDQMVSSKRFDQCRVIYNNPVASGTYITKGPLFPENAKYIEIGKFDNNALQSEKRIKLCKDVGANCEGSNMIGQYNPKNNGDIYKEFSPAILARQMQIEEEQTKVVLAKEDDVSGECFITNQSEPNIGAAASFGNQDSNGEWNASISSVLLFPKTNISSTFACQNRILQAAASLKGADYKWGACSINTLEFDCSGYVTAVLRQVGLIQKERFTTAGIKENEYFKKINKLEIQAGDLIVSNRGTSDAHVVIFSAWANVEKTAMYVWQAGGSECENKVCYTIRQEREIQEYFTYKNDCGTYN